MQNGDAWVIELHQDVGFELCSHFLHQIYVNHQNQLNSRDFLRLQLKWYAFCQETGAAMRQDICTQSPRMKGKARRTQQNLILEGWNHVAIMILHQKSRSFGEMSWQDMTGYDRSFGGESWMEFITHLDRFWEAKVVVGSMAKLLDWQWLSYLESWQLGGNVWYWLN